MKIGIDLGTTTSTVVRLDPKGKPRAPYTTDSLAAWRNGQLTFGDDATRALNDPSAPAFPIRDIKLSLGSKNVEVGGEQIDVEVVVAGLFKYLANKIAPGQEIKEAVIGTPVNVTESHRLALVRSAEAAGFQSVKLIYEPTSALVGAIEPRNMSRYGTVLVVDWGGGTLDLSLIRKEGDCLREIAVDGDASILGGSQMDSRILQRIVTKSPALREKLALIPGGGDRLKVQIEKDKIELLESADPAAERTASRPRWLGETVVLEGQDVVEVVMGMGIEGASQVLEFLQRADLSVADVTHVLFAGGVCRCALVRDQILDVLPGIQLLDTTMPQQLTGYGCARLLSYGFDLQLASDFGVLQSDGSFCALLPSGYDIGLGTYRTADFLVTDPLAAEATFDFGLVPNRGNQSAMLASSASGYVSLQTMFVRCQQIEGSLTGSTFDLIRVYSGISQALAVTVHGESNVGGASVTETISRVPFLIRLNGLS